MITAFPAAARSLARLEAASWIDLQSPNDEEAAEVELATGLKIPSREDVSAIEASSRLQRIGSALYLSTPLLAAGEATHLSPVGFVLTPERLITLRFDKLGAFDLAAGHMHDDPDLTGFGAFTCLFESIVDKLADGLELLGAELDHVSHGVFHQKSYRRGGASEILQRQTLAKVGRVGERLSQIKDVLLSVGRIVPFVLEVLQAETPGADRRAAEGRTPGHRLAQRLRGAPGRQGAVPARRRARLHQRRAERQHLQGADRVVDRRNPAYPHRRDLRNEFQGYAGVELGVGLSIWMGDDQWSARLSRWPGSSGRDGV